MARLTKGEKDAIIDRVIAKTFNIKKALPLKNLQVLIDQVPELVYGKETIARMRAADPDWFMWKTRICISFLPEQRRPSSSEYVSLSAAVPVKGRTAEDFNLSKSTDMDAAEAWQQAYYAVCEAIEDLDYASRQLRSELNKLLAPITTEKRLLELRPGGAEYMTPLDRSENLPAVQFDTFTEKLARLQNQNQG